MSWRTSCLRLIWLTWCVAIALPTVAGAQGQFTPGSPIRPLEALWDAPQERLLLPASHEEPAENPQVPAAPANQPAPRSVTELAHTRAERLQKNRSNLKDALGNSSGEPTTDSFTTDILRMAQWTSAILIVATLGAIGFKKFGQPKWQTAVKQQHLRIVESLSLGRQGGVHLVAIGDERLVVAADQHGIKAMTLLPSWPSTEEETDAAPVAPTATSGRPAVTRTFNQQFPPAT